MSVLYIYIIKRKRTLARNSNNVYSGAANRVKCLFHQRKVYISLAFSCIWENSLILGELLINKKRERKNKIFSCYKTECAATNPRNNTHTHIYTHTYIHTHWIGFLRYAIHAHNVYIITCMSLKCKLT